MRCERIPKDRLIDTVAGRMGMAQSEERSLLTMKSRVRIPTELNNTMQYALIPNYARRMELPLVAPGAGGRVPKKKPSNL